MCTRKYKNEDNTSENTGMERGEGRERKGRGEEERKGEGETRHTNLSLLPAPLFSTELFCFKTEARV